MTCTSTSASMTHAHEPARYQAMSLTTIKTLRRINIACRDHGISKTRFGIRAVGDPRLYWDLMKGRHPGLRTRRLIARFIAKLGEA